MSQYANAGPPGPGQYQPNYGPPGGAFNQGGPPQMSKPPVGPYGAAGPVQSGMPPQRHAANGPSGGPQYGHHTNNMAGPPNSMGPPPSGLGAPPGGPVKPHDQRPNQYGHPGQFNPGMPPQNNMIPQRPPPHGTGPGGLSNQMAGMSLNQGPPGMGQPPPPQGQGTMQRPPLSQPGPGPYGVPTSGQYTGGYGVPPPGIQNVQPPFSGAHGPPPGGSHGPIPGGMQRPGPPGPPNSMMGPQPGMQGPSTSMPGPHGMQGAPPVDGHQPLSRYPTPQPQGYRGPPPPAMGGVQQGVPAYPGGPPVGPPQGTPPMSPGPMGSPGIRQPYPAGPPSGPGMPPGPSVQPPPKKLDPDQMPSVIQVIETDRNARGGQQFVTSSWGQVPPLVTTDFQVIDQGNSSPRFFRSTVYSIPCNQDMVKQSQIPIGLVIKPFAELPANEMVPPITDHGPNGPVRCNRCKAYMCPFMTFVEGGRRFQCAFCTGVTDVPPEYIQPLDHMGKRVDMYERPELSLGSFEYLATTDYCKNSKLPQPPAYIFMIDVTYQSVKTGMVHLLCKELKSLLDRLPTEHGMKETAIRVGFVTYDTTLHFYNVNSALAQPQMMVVSDVHDVFMPLLDGFLVKLSDSRAVIESLLDQIPEMFFETRETESMLAPVVEAGLAALVSADISGKLFVFHSSLPIADAPGKLKNRDDRKLLGTEKEKTILTPQSQVYSKLGQECVKAGCSVDLFLFPNSYVDVATVGQVSSLTGGHCYKYKHFQAAVDGERFIHDLTKNLERTVGFDAVLRVRTSAGIRPTDFFGNFYMSNTTDVELAALDSTKAVTVEIKHDDKLQEDAGAFAQVAVLYTSVSGQRRLRILNFAFNCCSQLADLYKNCDTDTMVNFLAKKAAKDVVQSNPKSVREGLMSRCANILACYRKNCASPSTQGQLILPECMKVLPLFVNSIIKSDAIAGCTDITTDDRSWLMQMLLGMDVMSTHVYFYPPLIPVHDINPDSDDIPTAMRCSVERFSDSGVYLLENGLMMFLWIGLHVSNDWVLSVFGVNSPAQIDIDSSKLLLLDNPLSLRLRNLVEKIRGQRSRYMKLAVVRQRDTLEPWFKQFLVEDKGANASASYVDFLVHMHKEIRNILS